MGTRVAVLNRGALQQVATPGDLYEYPCNRFVADFIGSINLFAGTLASDATGLAVIDCPELGTSIELDRGVTGTTGASLWIGIRPEKIAMAPSTDPDAPLPSNAVKGRVAHGAYLGSETMYEVALAGGHMMKVRRPNARRSGEIGFAAGDPVLLSWSGQAPVVLAS